jgi:hypothetical protein
MVHFNTDKYLGQANTDQSNLMPRLDKLPGEDPVGMSRPQSQNARPHCGKIEAIGGQRRCRELQCLQFHCLDQDQSMARLLTP